MLSLRNSNLGQAWLVLMLALVFGSALAAVQTHLSGIIAANKARETLDKIPEVIWGAPSGKSAAAPPGTVSITAGSLEVGTSDKPKTLSLFRVNLNGHLAGWVLKAAGQGYADKIELLLGLDPGAQKITGLFVLDQKETPGLGGKIILSDWRGQFVDKKTGLPIQVQKTGASLENGIDAITGATISSRSVTAIINQVLADSHGKITPDNFRPKKE
jgi:electron transport complex protein RnfG